MLKFTWVSHQYLETGNQITIDKGTHSSILLHGEPPSRWLCSCTWWLDQKCNQSHRRNTPRLLGSTGFSCCCRRRERDQSVGAVNRLLTETQRIKLTLNKERHFHRNKAFFRVKLLLPVWDRDLCKPPHTWRKRRISLIFHPSKFLPV